MMLYLSGAAGLVGRPFTDADEWDYQRVRIMQLFRWTPEIVDNLDAHTLRDIWAVISAQMKHNDKIVWFP